MSENNKLKILFLCTGNSCRSQMAEGWARHLKAGRIEACSAGTEPKEIDPRMVTAMAERGIDVSAHRSKHVSELEHISFDYVVTVCGHANENCPFFPGKTKIVHRGFEDPPKLAESAATEEEAMGHYRRIRDEIEAYIQTLPESLADEDVGFRVTGLNG